MSLNNQQLHSLNNSLHDELTDVNKELTESYDYCQMIQEMNHDLRIKNIQLESLAHSLDKRIKRGYLQ